MERAVRETLSALEGLDLEVVVEEDGSTDRTAEVARALAAEDPRVRALSYPGERLGKGGGFVRGAAAATKDVVVLLDADLAVHPREVRRALERIDAGADLVIGSREAEGGRRVVDQTRSRRAAGRAYALLVRLLFGIPFADVQCGFKAMRRGVLGAVRLTRTGWEFDTELVWKARRAGLRVEEMGVEWTEGGRSRLRIFPDAPRMLWGLLRLRAGR